MGLSYIMMDWLGDLHSAGTFAGKRSVLELGPQDFHYITPDNIRRLSVRVRGTAPDRQEIEWTFFDAGQARRWTAIRDLYALLGLDDYSAADTDDERAVYTVDLNQPVGLGRKFDVITDFGTLEHVFNIGTAIKFIHDHLEIGGIALHVLPTRGDYNHGFFNIHSTFYLDLCAANDYELVDLRFLPEFSRQGTFRHREDPHQRAAILTLEELCRQADYGERSYAEAVLAPPPGDMMMNDYIFTAIRKRSDTAFVFPMQGIYAGDKVDARRSHTDNADHRSRQVLGVHIGLAHHYLAARRWDEVDAQLAAARAIEPDNVEALYIATLRHWNVGHFPAAIEAVQRICAVTPHDAKAFRLLALLRSGVAVADLNR